MTETAEGNKDTTQLLEGSETKVASLEPRLEEALTAGRKTEELYQEEMVKRREDIDRLTQLLKGSKTKVASLEPRLEEALTGIATGQQDKTQRIERSETKVASL